MFVYDTVWTLLKRVTQLREKRLPGTQKTTSQSSKFFWYLCLSYLLIGDLIMQQSNFTLLSLSSSTAVVSAASAGLPITATTSQTVSVTSVQLQSVQVHFTQDQIPMVTLVILLFLRLRRNSRRCSRMELGLQDLDCLL